MTADRRGVPSHFHLVAGVPWCPCGFGLTPACVCTPERRERFGRRLPRLLQEAFDLHVSIPPSDPVARRHSVEGAGEDTATVQTRVVRARQAQAARRQLNAENLSLTPTARVARTLADLAGSIEVTPAHTAEAATFAGPKFNVEGRSK